MATVRKQYVEIDGRAVHLRYAGEPNAMQPDLYCLHPAPSSGLYFETALPLLAASRRTLAPDYPGYGGSDPLLQDASISAYADIMSDTVAAVSGDAEIDLFGFHTGCLVAVEMALAAKIRVRRLILCDVPYFDADTRAALQRKMATPLPLSGNLDSLAAAWEFNVSKRLQHVPLQRAFALFVEHLRAGTDDHLAFDAAFTYPCEQRFAELTRPCTVLATQSGLLEPSRAAADAMPNAELLEAMDIETAVFESSAAAIVTYIDRTLIDD